MATGRIGKRSVDGCGPAERDVYLWDGELAGFGLKVTPNGRKSYLVQYRIGGRNGRTRRVTIGTHGELTAEQARTEAKRLLGEVSAGRDPSTARDARKDALTLGQALDRFIADYATVRCKPSTALEYARMSKLHVKGALRGRDLNAVTRADIARLLHGMRAIPCAANKTRAVLSKMFAWAEGRGLYRGPGNPCARVEKYAERGRERFLSELELARLGEALRRTEEAGSATPWAIAAIRLLTLTGARLSEVLTLRWEWIDLERAAIRLPDSKTGRKTLYLNAPALTVLASLPRLEGNPHVICGARDGARLVNLQKPWRRIRKAAGLDDVRIHDLRHSHASVGAGGGFSLPVIGALLGHSQPQTTARYAHLSDDPLRAASEAIGRRIAAAMDASGGGGGELVTLAGKHPRTRA